MMFRGLMLAAAGAAVLSFATAAHAEDDLWRSQLEVGSFDVFHKANSESFDLQLRPGWRLWDFGVMIGGMATTKGALMGYGGFTLDIPVIDNFFIVADATAGYYSRGNDKVLSFGSTAEFRTGGGVAYEFDNGWRLGADFHHISNAGLDKKNPGVEIAAITLSVPLFGKPAPMTAPMTEKVTKLTVTGHTDTVGSDAYNMRLSMRRATTVQQQLIKDGVPAGEIAIFAKGKRDLLVPTADGVKEPQNRRVQIVLE
jgi:hypothetical protein